MFIIFLIAGIGLFVHQIFSSGIEGFIEAIREFSLLKFLFFVSLSFINFYLFSLRWKLVVRALYNKKKVPWTAFFFDRMAGYAVSYVTPVAQLGGEPLRVMLMEEEGVPRRIVAQSTVIEKALELASLVFFISIGILISVIEPGLPWQTKIMLGSVGFVMLFTVFWFYYTSYRKIGFFTSIIKTLRLGKIKQMKKYEKKMDEFENEMNNFYHDHPRIMNALILISLITIGFILAEHYLVAYFLGVQLTFLQTFMIATIPYIAYLLPVPAGLGVLESGAATVFLLQGVTINAFAFVFIIRLRDFIFVAMGLIRGSQKGINLLKKEFKDEYSQKNG